MLVKRFELKPFPRMDYEVGLLFSMLEDTRRNFKENVKDLTPEELTRVPDGLVNSVGTLLLHVAAAELWWIQEVLKGEKVPADIARQVGLDIDRGPDFSGHLKQAEPRDVGYFFEKLDYARGITRELCLDLKSADLDTIKIGEREGRRFEVPVRWILYHVFEHEARHRGQTLMLKRLIKGGKSHA